MDEQDKVHEKEGTRESTTASSKHVVEKEDTFVNSQAVVQNDLFPVYNVFESCSHQARSAWLFLLATVVLCAWTVSFAYSSLISNKKVPRYYDFSPTKTIRMLNIASVITILLVKSLISAVLDAFSCALASAPGGTSVLTFRATQKMTDISDLGKLLLIFGKHQIWSIMRILITTLTIVASILLMSEVTSNNVYNEGEPFTVIAGLADLHETIQKLEKSNVFHDTSNVQETGINMLILGTTRSILTDPTIAVPIMPTKCKKEDCVSVFLPGGLGLVRYRNGSVLTSSSVPSINRAIIINEAPGYQMEFSSTEHTFNHSSDSTDCKQYGLPISSLYFCIKYDNEILYSGISICPFNLMEKGACESDNSWTTTLDASLALSIFRRTATVAYDKTNFSILSIEKISMPILATHPNITTDLQSMFSIMYPAVNNILADIAGAITNPSSIYPELTYWASVYCVQSEVSSANWLYKTGFPTWVTGERDILAGFLAIPIQFGTLLWQWVDMTDMPPTLSTTASGATAVYRARVKPWTVCLFTGIISGLVLWAVVCLGYVHFIMFTAAKPRHSPTLEAAFKDRNPFVVTSKGFLGVLGAAFCCFCFRPNKARNLRGGDEEYVAVRSLKDKTLVVVQQPEA